MVTLEERAHEAWVAYQTLCVHDAHFDDSCCFCFKAAVRAACQGAIREVTIQLTQDCERLAQACERLMNPNMDPVIGPLPYSRQQDIDHAKKVLMEFRKS